MDVLVVDDEVKIADALAERLRLRGHGALPVYDARSALSELESRGFHGIILDLRLPDMDGLEVLKRVMSVYTSTRVVILSGHGNQDDFDACLENGAVACFQKPADITKLIGALVGNEETLSRD